MIKRKSFNLLILLIAIIAIGFGYSFYYKLHKLESDNMDRLEKEKTTNVLIAKVANLYLLPEGETPTIATVSDPLLLQQQSFFLDSQIGDKVLIFSKSNKAILYRPSIDKIIEVTSINNNFSLNGN